MLLNGYTLPEEVGTVEVVEFSVAVVCVNFSVVPTEFGTAVLVTNETEKLSFRNGWHALLITYFLSAAYPVHW